MFYACNKLTLFYTITQGSLPLSVGHVISGTEEREEERGMGRYKHPPSADANICTAKLKFI